MELPSLSRVLRPVFGSRPILGGRLLLAGLRAPVTIRHDRYAVPHIDARNEHDAWFALGFCQARDRPFQLELRLRTQRGTLSQLVGEKTLPIDRLARRIGFAESSRRQMGSLDGDVREQVEAFTAGINTGMRAGTRRRPMEFRLLRAEPSMWRPEDVIGVGKLVSFLLIGNWDVELARLKILVEDGPQALRDLDPVFAAHDLALSTKDRALKANVDALSQDLASFVEFAGVGGGSNAWVLGGDRTASGRPLLANDPHLEPVMPPHWYLAHIRTPDWAAAGASLVGTPAIAIGHNGFAAWGITAGLADTVDLFIEEVGPDGLSVKRGGSFEACARRTELIELKGRSPVIEEVLETPRGPIIGPALDNIPLALSMSAVWLENRRARGFLRAHQARDFQTFRSEFEHWPLFSQNALYADASGRIAWQLVGQTPRRRKGWGTLPLHASNPETGWHEEHIPLDAMPHAVDPKSAFLVSANHRPENVATASRRSRMPFLGVDWMDDYRASRITDLVSRRQDWDLHSSMRVALDTFNPPWPEVGDIITSARPASEAGQQALAILAGWDGDLAAHSTAATLHELLCGEMWRRIVNARAPRSAQWALGRGFTSLVGLTTFTGGRFSTLVGHLKRQPEGWFERTWQQEIGDALDSVVEYLTQHHGPDIAGWSWGKVRPLTLEHPLSAIKLLAPLVNRGPFPWGGSSNTVSQAGVTPLMPITNPTVIASLRFAVEAGDWENARYALPGGQSGDPLSPHYDDILPLWLRGEGIRIAWTDEAVARATVATLWLEPLSEGL